MKRYRELRTSEIAQLEAAGCVAEDWKEVKVTDGFNPSTVAGVRFYGRIRMGNFSGTVRVHDGLRLQCGIYNATLHNVSVRNHVLISNVSGYISGYNIRNGVCIMDVGIMSVDGGSTFGNGTVVTVMNESGGRHIPIIRGMSAQEAYLYIMYGYRDCIHRPLQRLFHHEIKESHSVRGTIGRYSKILGVKMIKDVRVGDYALLQGCHLLEKGTVESSRTAPTYMGEGVICSRFIVSSGSTVTSGARLSKVFIGQGVAIANGFSATDCLFFANSHMENGEAVSVFAGPFTVSHHKSSLLIASMYSFANAGSATNFSNHMYKTGPVHHGIFSRGCKFGSGSHVVLPSHLSPFTTVLGHHDAGIDLSAVPFSYLMETDHGSLAVPGANLCSVGLYRDALKWPVRDTRSVDKADMVHPMVFSPYTMQSVKLAILALQALMNVKGARDRYSQVLSMGPCELADPKRGVERYSMAMDYYMATVLQKRFPGQLDYAALRGTSAASSEEGAGNWMDMAGLLMPTNLLDNLQDALGRGEFGSVAQLHKYFEEVYLKYDDYEWAWFLNCFREMYDTDLADIGRRRLRRILSQWEKSVEELRIRLLEDVRKDFSMYVGYGVDAGESEAASDFRAVRGTLEEDAVYQWVEEHFASLSDYLRSGQI